MLISCKCLNFIAASNNQRQKQQPTQPQHVSVQTEQQQQQPAASTAAVATADLKENSGITVAAVALQPSSSDCSNTLVATSSNNNNNIIANSSKGDHNETFSLTNALRQAFLQKYPRNFIFYSQCVDFFKQAIGPLSDLTINNVSQRDLIYSLTLDITESHSSLCTSSSWQLSICSNCNVVLCAKRLQNDTPQFFINCGLLTNNEELSQKRADKSFSDTFGILIMDHPKLEIASNNQNHNNSANLTIGSLSTSFATSAAANHLDSKQFRLRQLQANLQQRLQREIAETDERIQRYTAQQFALLKNFREKSEQEYQMLVTLIQCIPDQQSNEWLDRLPPILDVSNNGSNLTYGGSRRRNTISSRRELNTAPSTPTSIQPPNNIFSLNRESQVKNSSLTAMQNSPSSAIVTEVATTNNTRSPPSGGGRAVTATTPTTVVSGSSALNRKMSNFDTPPATPEAIPMSVGNSPTFRQQQNLTFVNQQQSFQQQFPTPTIETADDCLFELEGVDSTAAPQPHRTMFLQNPPSPMRLLQTQQPHNVPHHLLPNSNSNSYQRHLNYINTQAENHMSDLDESDGAEEAEDALDLDTSMPIATPQRRVNSKSAAQAANFAKSLPIEIANSPLAVGRSYMATLESDEDELDNNVDIAASIKALAKSVHGEAVFGDLPRPRLRSQI
ncbi:hypothetical protein DOY81_001417 [Sarcophaga bullata]|nr:hypothetical protein DOY81_001417 [Sarcophaga bullata]